MEPTSRESHFELPERNEPAVDADILCRLYDTVQNRLSMPSLVPQKVTTRRIYHDGDAQHLRLVSGSKPTIILIKRDSAVVSRILEDTPDAEVRRQKMAKESAVELCDIMDYFREGLSAPKRSLPLSYKAQHSFNTFNNIAILRPASMLNSEHSAHPTLMAIHTLPDQDDLTRTVVERKRRKRRRAGKPIQRSKEHTRPQFYEPLAEVGGKSAGYAMGWCLRGHVRSGKYVRSKMGKGIQTGTASV